MPGTSIPCMVSIEFVLGDVAQRGLWMTASPIDLETCRCFWFMARTDDLDGSDDPHIEFQRIVLAQDLPVVTNQVPRWLPLEPRYTAPSATPSAQISPGRRSQSDRFRKVAIVAWQVSPNAVKLPNLDHRYFHVVLVGQIDERRWAHPEFEMEMTMRLRKGPQIAHQLSTRRSGLNRARIGVSMMRAEPRPSHPELRCASPPTAEHRVGKTHLEQCRSARPTVRLDQIDRLLGSRLEADRDVDERWEKGDQCGDEAHRCQRIARHHSDQRGQGDQLHRAQQQCEREHVTAVFAVFSGLRS